MATYNINRNGIHFKIEITWRPDTITTKKGWFIRLSYLCKKTITWKMIISETKENVIARNNMIEFLKTHSKLDLPTIEDYEKAKEEFFKQEVKNTDLPEHICPLDDEEYKWIDLKRERETTENPIWWLKGCMIIFVWFLALLVVQYWL